MTLLSSVACGEEDWNVFLDALKARGYEDVAVVYLNSLKASGATPPEIDQELDYKIGEAALEACAKASGSERDSLGAQARAAFEKYLDGAPDGAFAAEANAGCGKLATERGDRLLADANKKGVSSEARDAKLLEARGAFSDAKPSLEAALAGFKDRAKKLQEDATSDPNALRAAQGAFLDVSLRLATLLAQTARTFAPDSAEYKDGLTAAADRLDKLFTTYQQYAGAFRARYEEAVARWELGDADRALGLLSELAVLPSEDQFVGLKTRSLRLFAEIAEKKDAPETTMELVKKFNDWKSDENIPSAHYDSVEGREIALAAGRALIRLEKMRRNDYDAFNKAGLKTFVDRDDPTFKMLSAAAKKKKDGANQIVALALKTLGELAAGRGSVAIEARDALKDEIFEGIDASKYSFAKKVDDFPSAVAAVDRDASAFSNARDEYKSAASESADAAKTELDGALNAALKSFVLANDLSAKAVRPDKKGKILEDERQAALKELDRVYLKEAVVCYAAERYEDAFVLGDWLANRRPDCEDASQGALIALRSLQALVRTSRDRGASEEVLASLQARLDAYTALIGEKWSGEDAGSSIGQEATLVQLNAAVASGDVEGAKAQLDKIPENSPNRATAELQLGRALWAEWNKRNAEAESTSDDDASDASDDDKAKLDELLNGANQTLYAGLEHKLNSPSGATEDDYVAIYSSHLLAQTYERLGDLTKAEEWLTHPVIGALSAIERVKSDGEGDARVSDALDDNFRIATFALALRLATAKQDGFDEAEKYIGQLEEIVARSPENASKLTGVYLQLGKRLEERLRELKEAADAGDESKKEDLASTTKGFEAFLSRALARDAGNGYGSLRWIADSYLSLGRGLTPRSADPPKEALTYFSEAGKTYQSILKKIDADASFAPDGARLIVSLKVVECLRSAGAYSKAFEQLKKLALSSPDNLDVQLEAARLFRDWGRKDSQYYLKSITGGGSGADGKNIIWGWNGIIKRLSPSVEKGGRFKELFYEAYLEKTSCRYRYAEGLKDADARAKQAKDAEADISRLYQIRPDLGGPATFKKFDSAYKKFQKLRGEKTPVGLVAASKKNESAAAAEKK